jgi:hypothetical protein
MQLTKKKFDKKKEEKYSAKNVGSLAPSKFKSMDICKEFLFYANARAERYERVKLRTSLLLTIEFLCSS